MLIFLFNKCKLHKERYFMARQNAVNYNFFDDISNSYKFLINLLECKDDPRFTVVCARFGSNCQNAYGKAKQSVQKYCPRTCDVCCKLRPRLHAKIK